MVIELKEVTEDNFLSALEQFGVKRNQGNKKTLAEHFGKLKRGIDGVQYQKEARYGWN